MVVGWAHDLFRRADYSERYGIPLLLETLDPTHSGYVELAASNERVRPPSDQQVAAYLEGMLVPTCGNLFHGVRLLDDYPIPDFPAFADGGVVVDIGCNWGRWSIAGALAGYRVIGVDIHLESLLVAQRLAKKLVPENLPVFVLADARRLPFKDGVLDGVFSYSVVQHFSRQNARLILGEAGRTLKPGGRAVIQMPNKGGLKARLTGAGKTEGSEFDVRYYAIDELLTVFEDAIGPTVWSVDCFFGLNVHARDMRFVPLSKRWIVHAATALKSASRRAPKLGSLADSVFLSSTKAS